MISIVVPVTKCKKNLFRLIESIENQVTGFHFELVLISKQDDSRLSEIIQNKIHPYIQFQWDFVNSNCTCKALNRGVRIATQPYVLFLDEHLKINSLYHIQQVVDFAYKNQNLSGFGGLFKENPLDTFNLPLSCYWNKKVTERSLTSDFTTYLYLLNSCFKKEIFKNSYFNESTPLLTASYEFYNNQTANQRFFKIANFMNSQLTGIFSLKLFTMLAISEGYEYNQRLRNLVVNLSSSTEFYQNKKTPLPQMLVKNLALFLVSYGRYLKKYPTKSQGLILNLPMFILSLLNRWTHKIFFKTPLNEAYYIAKKLEL